MKQNNFIHLCNVECKKSIKTIAFTILIGLLCYIIPLLSMKENSETTNIGLLIVILAISCYIIPIIQNGYKMNKRKVDRVYALPISKRVLAHAKMVMGLLEIIISYTILYWFGFIVVVIKQPQFQFRYYIPLYFIILLFAIIVYIFNFFISSRANTIFDAILLVILWSFVFLVIANLIQLFIEFFAIFSSDGFEKVDKLDVQCIPIFPFVEYGNFYNDWIVSRITDYRVTLYYTTDNPFQAIGIFSFIFYPILGVISYLGLYIMSSKDKGEMAEEITSGIFGYQPLMALYLLYIVILSVVELQYILFAIGITMYLVLDVIHQRKFKMNKNSLVIMVVTVMIGIVLGIFFRETVFANQMAGISVIREIR